MLPNGQHSQKLMRYMIKDLSYHTQHEIMFLNRLGTFIRNRVFLFEEYGKVDLEDRRRRRVRLLEAYLRSMPFRKEWQGINPGEVKNHVTRLIQKENGNVK